MSIKIPKSLIERLKPLGFRFIKVAAPELGNPSSGKRAVEHGWPSNPYDIDDPSFVDWIKGGGNYGILCGDGLIILIVPTRFEPPKTFTVTVGDMGHFYYLSDFQGRSKPIMDGDRYVGRVQAERSLVVGPGCRDHLGRTYKIINDVPFTWLSKETLETINL